MKNRESKKIYNENKYYGKDNNGDNEKVVQHVQHYDPSGKDKNLLLDLQLYTPPKPKPKPRPNPSNYLPHFVPNPYDPDAYAKMMQSSYGMYNPVNYVENNIVIDGVSGSHVKTSHIFEDSLPVRDIPTSNISLSGRLTLYEYIRSTILPEGDGINVPIENDKYNLLSRIRFMDLNPYNASRFSNNPYKGLPYGLLLYRSCYPIRFDNRNSSTTCAKNSMGLNVRIYMMTEGSYFVNNTGKENMIYYDEWRDVLFYEYIREHIIKQNVSPNFTILYGYIISPNSEVNFNEMKRNYNPSMFIQRSELEKDIRFYDPKCTDKNIIEIRSRKEIYLGKNLVLLTEASNYSIIKWTTKEYKGKGNLNIMSNYGYKTTEVWESIIFQLLQALLTMQRKGIIINNFDLNRNVFIKDISNGGKSTRHWKYVIDGIEYYIPNYGYVLLIDTNFRDFDNTIHERDFTNKERIRKVDGKFISEAFDENKIKEGTFNMMRKVINPDIFDENFIHDGGSKPPENILKLLSQMKSEIDSKPTTDIHYYIKKYMKKLMNNRIGTPLDDSETKFINEGAIREFRKGQILVMKDSDGFDLFVLHVETNDNISRIITRDSINPNSYNLIEKDVPTSSLRLYSVTQSITQKFDANKGNITDENLLETYVLN